MAARRSRLELIAERDSRSASIVKRWLENPPDRDRLIAAAQLGITIVSLALGAVGENTFEVLLEPYFHDLSLFPLFQSLEPVLTVFPLVLSLIIITSLHVVLGEQVPKVASLHKPEQTALLLARPMSAFESVFKWFVGILDWATRVILRFFRLAAGGEHLVMYTVDELKQIVTESEEGGIIETPEREMLHAIFDFGELLVRQVMIPRTEILGFEADINLDESIKIATQSTFTKFPVYEDNLDNILGIVHIKDLFRAEHDPQRKNCLARDLVREAFFVPETVPVRQVLQEFRTRRQHIAIVMDEFSGTAGLVTLEDLIEEIVGEVSDPFDSPDPEIQVRADGTVLIEGLALIEEVNEKLGLELDDPHYDTIAGFVLGKLNRMPQLGDTIEIGGGLRFEVIKMDGMRIEQLSLGRIDQNAVPEPSDES